MNNRSHLAAVCAVTSLASVTLVTLVVVTLQNMTNYQISVPLYLCSPYLFVNTGAHPVSDLSVFINPPAFQAYKLL